MRLLIALSFIVIASLGCSKSSSSKGTTNDPIHKQYGNHEDWWTIEQESDKWIVRQFREKEGEAQELVREVPFKTRAEALAFVERELQRLAPEERADKREAPIVPESLPEAKDGIWTATKEWSPAWEEQYKNWVRANLDQDFFVKWSIKTDCADVVFALRWIFARTYGLPMANRLGGSRKLMTNKTSIGKWSKLPTAANWHEDQRFLKALEYLLENTYTHTLFDDSYPVAINPSSVGPGTFHLKLREVSGHTRIVDRTYYNDPTAVPFSLLFSDVPKVVRKLMIGDFWNVRALLPEDGGFMQVRWAKADRNGKLSLVRAEEMPNYEMEQYSEEFTNAERHYDAVMKRLSPNLSPVRRLDAGLAYLETLIDYRIDVVEEGFAFCGVNDCSEGTSNYDDWSTPNRDGILVEIIRELEYYANRSKSVDPTGFDHWQILKSTTTYKIAGRKVLLADLIKTFKSSSYTSDPRKPVAERWGLSQ